MRNWKKVAFSKPAKLCISPRWIPTLVGVFKLNYNALGNPGMAGLGCSVRDSDGTTILSYSGPASHC